jgi:hypothetical protein
MYNATERRVCFQTVYVLYFGFQSNSYGIGQSTYVVVTSFSCNTEEKNSPWMCAFYVRFPRSADESKAALFTADGMDPYTPLLKLLQKDDRYVRHQLTCHLAVPVYLVSQLCYV